MKLGSGPFPLPIGQDKADVLKTFDVKKIDPDKNDPPQTIHLELTPKSGTDMAQKFSLLGIWTDRNTRMPVIIETVSASGGDQHRIQLKDLVVDPKPALSDKDFTLPPIDSVGIQDRGLRQLKLPQRRCTRAITPAQSFAAVWRNSLMLPGYHGQSSRSAIHRQSGECGTITHTGLPIAPASCATAESIVMIRSRLATRPAVSAKSANSSP